MIYKRIQLSFLIAALFMPLFEASAKDEPMAAVEASAVAISTVVDIDKANRIVTLKDEEGEEMSFTAGPDVRNFDQIKRGDQVIAQYFSAFAIALGPKDGGFKERADELEIQRAKLGDKPAAKVTRTLVVIGTVTAVDQKDRLVTIKGVEQTVVVGASHYVDLSKVEVGDEVEAVYIASFAVSVQPAPKVSGTVEIKSTSIALGIGVEWGKGKMTMFDGSTYTFDIKGMSAIDLGISKVEATGTIYNMVESKDLEGTFLAGEAGITLGVGASALAMKNSNGVILKLTSKQKGLKLTLAPEGLNITNIMREE